jgi:hypothetical protein
MLHEFLGLGDHLGGIHGEDFDTQWNSVPVLLQQPDDLLDVLTEVAPFLLREDRRIRSDA